MMKICLYLSSFLPMYLLLMTKILLEIVNKNLTFNILNSIMLGLLFLLVLSGGIGLYLAIKRPKSRGQKIVVVEKENITDQHFLGYFSLFVLFALTFEIEYISMAVVFVLIILLVGIVYVKSQLFYINPLLNILGYSFYNITFYTDNKEDLRKAKIFFKGDLITHKKTYFVKELQENLCFVDKKKKT